jgi:carbamoyl-phosphate synthase large subunit
VLYGVPCITTLPAAEACVRAMEGLRTDVLSVQPIQDRFSEPRVASVAALGG